MSWFSDIAGKAESLLNNIDEQTGAVLRNHAGTKEKKRDLFTHTEKTPIRKKKLSPTNIKKNGSISETKSNCPSTAKSFQSKSPYIQTKDIQVSVGMQRKKSPNKYANQYHLNNSPRTLMEDYKDRQIKDCQIKPSYGLRKRRNSLPADLEILNNHEIAYNMQNLEVENAMLKNELNVVNAEVSDLLDRLRKTEDELTYTKNRLNVIEESKVELSDQKESLATKLEELRSQTSEESRKQISKHKEQNVELQSEVDMLNHKYKDLEERIQQLHSEMSDKVSNINKLEKELRHAQNIITELHDTIEKANSENQRLEKDWKAYTLRVKNMLFTKDNEIKTLREGNNLTEDTKVLMEHVESLKEEREELSSAVSRARDDSAALRFQMSQIEARRSAAERVTSALRDTLKEERAARNKAEAQGVALTKEMQSIKMQTYQTIANLRTALLDKEEEVNCLKNSSSVPTTDTSLNVADCVVHRDIETEKIRCLTQTVVQKQGKIDSLRADNNILRIQLEKLECKYRNEMAALRAKHSHSVVHLQDGDSRIRSRYHTSPLSTLSWKIGVMIKRFPLFRTFLLFYMIGLHLWVFTVLFASTPDDHVPKPIKL